MSTPPKEFEWPSVEYWLKNSTESTTTGNYKMYANYYQRIMPEVDEYMEKMKIRNESKKRMIENAFYEFKYENPCAEIKLRGSMGGSCTNIDKVEEPEEETQEEELQYFDPKDLDI